MGRPSGLARSSRAPADRNPAAAPLVAALLKNSLLEICDIHTSIRVESAWSMSSQRAVLSHNSWKMDERRDEQGGAADALGRMGAKPRTRCRRPPAGSSKVRAHLELMGDGENGIGGSPILAAGRS